MGTHASRDVRQPGFQQRQASGEPPFVGGHMEFWTIEATYGE
jgi:hypothetical protein